MSMLPGALRAEHAKKRWSDDFYVEPPECVHRLFNTVQFDGVIHDPCCGGGTIPRVALEHGYTVTASELRDRGYGETDVDFFTDDRPRENIVSNPPYKMGHAFVRHALNVTERKIAIVMRTTFLNGQTRGRELFKPFPLALVVILSRRPSMPPGGRPDIKAEGGTADYCWLVWDRRHVGPTIMKWA